MADIGIIKFQIADIHFGMFADRILEIVRLDNFRPIPRPLSYVVGLTELRNYIVTIVDFRKRLGLTPLPDNRSATMIVLKLSLGVIGLLVESISNFKRVPEEEILSPFSIAGLPAQLLQGVLTADEDITIVPDLNKIFSSYIPLHLSSITSSEKIAFQYRSTPGAISRTLENTLISQGYLDEEIILKLPRSMSLPSVHVHKFISYYPDFQPRKHTRTAENEGAGTSQQTRDADASYTSLSKRLEHRQQGTYSRRNQQTGQRVQALPFSPRQELTTAFEIILKGGGDEPAEQQLSPQRVLSNRELGRRVAKTLRVAPVRLIKYLSFYPRSSETENYPSSRDFFTQILPEQQAPKQRLSLDERLNQLLRHTRSRLEEVLQTLEQEAYVIRRKALRRIGEHYQVSPMRIARVASHFPDLRIDLTLEPEDARLPDEPLANHAETQLAHEEKERIHDAEAYQALRTPLRKLRAERATLNTCLQYLAAEECLEDDRAVRYAASQLQIATCRLSTLRSYYQFRGK